VVPGERTDTVAHDINDRGDIVIPADGTVANPRPRAAARRRQPQSRRRLPRYRPEPTQRRVTLGENRTHSRRRTAVGLESLMRQFPVGVDPIVLVL
jgi:hypothetical protein